MSIVTARRRDARRNQRNVVRLYRKGMSSPEIARRLDLSPTTVNGHLRHAGVKRRPQWTPVPVGLKRPPYQGLLRRNGSVEVVLGRKFCPNCGRWRHLCDFPYRSSRGTTVARCLACCHASAAHRFATATPEQVKERREYWRIYRDAQRARSGQAPRRFRRSTVIDRREAIYLPVEPLLNELRRYSEGEFGTLAASAGVPERTIYRFRHGESQKVQIDVADKLAVAMGTTCALVWGDQW